VFADLVVSYVFVSCIVLRCRVLSSSCVELSSVVLICLLSPRFVTLLVSSYLMLACIVLFLALFLVFPAVLFLVRLSCLLSCLELSYLVSSFLAHLEF
jgi:hypothetical protein